MPRWSRAYGSAKARRRRSDRLFDDRAGARAPAGLRYLPSMTAIALSKPRASRVRRRSRLMRKAMPYLMVAPAVLYLLCITLYPGVFAIWRSFYAGRFKLEPVGFDQYWQLFADSAFRSSLWNTFLLGSVTLLVEFVIAMTLAALVYRDPWVKSWR